MKKEIIDRNLARAREQIHFIRNNYFQFIESPAAARYQVEEVREEILAITDKVSEDQLERLSLTEKEVNNLPTEARNSYYCLLTAESDLNTVVNFNVKFKTGVRISSDIMKLIHDHQKYFNPMLITDFKRLALDKLDRLSRAELRYLFELHNHA